MPMPAVDLEKEIQSINASLAEVGDQLKAHGESAKAEIAKHQQLSAETRENVDKLLLQQGELTARLQAAEQLVASLESGGGPRRPLSAGQQIVESEEWQHFAANPTGRVRLGVNALISTDFSEGVIPPQRVPGIVPLGQRRMTVRQLLNWGRTTSGNIEFVRETGFTNNAEVVSENPAAGKPESTITLEADQAPVATIAHYMHASRQVLSDFAMLQSYIDGRLRYGLELKEEAQLLMGSGVGLNIEGLYTQATPYANPGINPQAESRIDRLRLAMLQVELAEYYPDGIVLNSVDWAAIEMMKDTTNQYLFANPRGVQTPVLWGRNVVPTQAMGVGDFLTGSFAMGAQAWDREDANVMISLEDRDNFIKNMVTILAEERIALTVVRPESFVKGSFADLGASL